MDCVYIKVHGRVQGVFFRANTQREGARLKLGGWVRNMPDGGVEIEAWGEKAALEKFVAWCHRGPEAALVEKVEAVWGKTDGASGGFHIRY